MTDLQIFYVFVNVATIMVFLIAWGWLDIKVRRLREDVNRLVYTDSTREIGKLWEQVRSIHEDKINRVEFDELLKALGYEWKEEHKEGFVKTRRSK